MNRLVFVRVCIAFATFGKTSPPWYGMWKGNIGQATRQREGHNSRKVVEQHATAALDVTRHLSPFRPPRTGMMASLVRKQPNHVTTEIKRVWPARGSRPKEKGDGNQGGGGNAAASPTFRAECKQKERKNCLRYSSEV